MASTMKPEEWHESILNPLRNTPISIFGYNHVAMDKTKEIGIIDALVWCGLCESNGEARKAIKNNGVMVNRQRISDFSLMLSQQNALTNLDAIVLERGKYNFGIIELC